jgi:hypothetical protein
MKSNLYIQIIQIYVKICKILKKKKINKLNSKLNSKL